MEAGFIVLRVLFLLDSSVSVAQSLNIRIFEECYGSLFDNYLTASCDTGQVISIISLKAFAKRRDTKCPQEETAQTPLPSDSCCRYNDSDCGDIYLGDGLAHYLSCNGRRNCLGIPIAWMDTPCKTGEYLNKTSYMRMEYECIPSSGTVDVANNSITIDDEVHVWNPNYPDGNAFTPGGTMTCSVEASCQSRIVVTAIFLKFLEVSAGVCGQQMTIEDGMYKKEISCESNNNYNISDVYTSSSHFIKVKVNSSVASNQDWRFWFKFKGIEPYSQMILGCGSQKKNSAQNPNPGICIPMSTTPRLSTTPAPPINSIMDQSPNTNTTCPGKLQQSYLKPSCDSSEVIAVRDLFVGSKPAASMCPANLDIGVYNETLRQQCCTRGESDCITQYSGASRLNFFLSCNGRSRCDNNIPKTDTRPTACSGGGPYLANSNYMIMIYHCINTANIIQVGQDNSTNINPAYISNDDFPSETQNKSDTDKTCSIQAECGTRIRVVLVHLSLKDKEACQQKITFTEEDGNQTVIDCHTNTESEVKELFNSSTSFLLMTFANKLPGGKFWIEFTSLKQNFLTVSCGKEHPQRSACLPTTQSSRTTAAPEQSSSGTVDVANNSITIDDEVHFWNPNYPDGNTFPPGGTMTCSVEVSCQSRIVVTAIFLKFLEVSAGVCGQQMTIEDGMDKKEIACESNNNYNISDVYTSSSHFIKVKVNSSVASNQDWRFWLKFKGVDPYSQMILGCGSQKKNSAQNPNPGICIPMSTTPTPKLSTTPAPPTNISVAQSLNIRIFEECYGSLFDNYLTASCDTGQVISIISLKAFAKRRDTKCPQEETAQTPLPSDSCCRYNDSDCGDIYLGDGLAHYLSCNGRRNCLGIPIAWMDTPCKTGEYLNKTSYMRMEYECIPSSGTVDVANNSITIDDEVHVWNPNYPDGNTFPPGGTMTCSVEASCQSRIVVTAIFLKFLEVSAGVCGQQMTIENGMDKKEISCESNNNYNISDVYTSSSHFIKVKVNSSVASNQDWRFWFKFKGVEPYSQMILGCGSQKKNSAQNPSPGICIPMSTTPRLSTTPAPPINSIMDKSPNTNTTCPGKLQQSYLKPSCDSSEVIAVRDLFVGSKPAASMCPANLDIGVYNETLRQQCCTRSESDCITQYTGGSRLNFFLSCNGRSRCDNSIPQTDTRPTACSGGGPYLANSNYMIMIYHCIDTANIIQVGQDNSTNRNPVYITNDDFPSETPNKYDTDKTCSIQAECGTTIRVVLVHLSLKDKEACQQKITFTEEDGNQTVIDCHTNTESEVKNLFNSSTSFLLMTFANKLPGGKFWIEFTSLKQNFLRVSCGKEHSQRSACLPTTQSPPTTAAPEQSSSGTVDVANNSITIDDEVHVWNPNYPDGNTFPPGGTMTCSVEASCQSRIVVTAIFLKFLEVSAGVCGQLMTIEDGMDKKEISCESNNNYNISDVYTSSSHFIKVKVNSSVASNQDWRFWFKFKGIEPYSQMILGCGSQKKNSAQNPSPGICIPMSTTPRLPTTPAPPTNSIMDQSPNTNTTCPGKLQQSYLKPSCGSSEVIAVRDLFVGSKPAASMCPANLDIGVYNETLRQQCCTRSESDCITQYTGGSRLNFFLSCNGRSRCDNSIPQTDTRPTACSGGGPYLANSNYMIMIYHCIDTANIIQVGQDNSTNRNPAYITNDDFPSETQNKYDTDKTCSIQAECGTRIRVVLVHLSLKDKEACQQKITFTEEDDSQTVIDCHTNTESEVKNLFNSSTSFLLMTFANKLPGGKFWIEFTSLKQNFLRVSCGKEHSQRSACLPTTQSTRTTAAPEQSTLLIAILVSLGVILIIAIVVCILCCRENISHRCYARQIHPKSVEDVKDVGKIFYFDVHDQNTAPVATTLDKRKSFTRRQTTHSLSYSKAVEKERHEVQIKPQLRKHTSEMNLLKANGQKLPLQKQSFSSPGETKSQLPATFGTADQSIDAEHVQDEKSARKERKRMRKEKKRQKRESRRRLLDEEQQRNKMGDNSYVSKGSATIPFRVAAHVANAFHPPVMRPYYPESGQENYYIPGNNMHDHQLPLAGSIYGYPASQHQNVQNIPVNGTASIRSTSTPVSANGSSIDAWTPPKSLAGSFRGTPAQPILMTGSFRGAPVQPPMSGSFRVPPIQRRPTLTCAPVSVDSGYIDKPITIGDSFHCGQIPMDATFRGDPSTGSLRRYPSAMSESQMVGEASLIFQTGQFEDQFVPQMSTHEPYKNSALSRWRAAGIAATFVTHLQTRRQTLEIGNVDNPNEREVNQVHDDSVV